MTHMSVWISPQLAHTLAWTLLHFLWQGLALAAICYAIMAACRTASARYAVALTALVLMLAAPVVTFVVLRNASVAATHTANITAIPSALTATVPSFAASGPSSAIASYTPAPLRPDTLLLLVETWFAGVVFFSLRTAGGLLVVHRMRRNRTRPATAALLEKCLALQRRMSLSRVVRYCECLALEAPAVIGWFRPVVLLPVTALSGLSEDQLAAVISHELAHIRRLDCFVNLFQIAAETLLFYHPAVWWLNKRIRNERENCCDDAALAVCGNPIEYARALTLMEEWRQRPALAMAANRSPLVERVARLLGLTSPSSGIRSAGVAASILCLAGALLAANGLMAAGHSSSPAITGNLYASEQMPGPSSRHKQEGPSAAASRLTASAASHLTKSIVSRLVAAVAPARTYAQANVADTQSMQDQKGQGEGHGIGIGQSQSSSSYVDQMKAQGYDNLTADELISLKIQGVTPEYISQIKALGLHPTISELISMRVQGIEPQYIKDMRDAGFNSDINQLISLRVQGITPDYVREMRAVGIDGDANKFISFKVQGVTPDYVKEMKATGFSATPNELISMKVQGITPDYVREMRAAGLDGDINKFIAFKVQGVTPDYIREMKAVGVNVDANQLIGMKVQGITPDYVKEMKAVGVTADANQLIGMKVQGLTPDYVKEMRAVGVSADTSQLIGMKVQGLDPEYVKDMKAAGVTADTNQLIGMKVQGLDAEYVKQIKAAGINASTNQLIGMRVQGVTPEYVKSLQSAGLQNLTAEDCIRARVQDITPEFIKEARSHGFKDLTLDKLIDLRNAGVF